jgi:hypothetical protein
VRGSADRGGARRRTSSLAPHGANASAARGGWAGETTRECERPAVETPADPSGSHRPPGRRAGPKKVKSSFHPATKPEFLLFVFPLRAGGNPGPGDGATPGAVRGSADRGGARRRTNSLAPRGANASAARGGREGETTRECEHPAVETPADQADRTAHQGDAPGPKRKTQFAPYHKTSFRPRPSPPLFHPTDLAPRTISCHRTRTPSRILTPKSRHPAAPPFSTIRAHGPDDGNT